MLITKARGVNDILPAETGKWRAVETLLHQMCAEYNFEEIRTPMFEMTDLFKRGVGEFTDIVQKEMYTLESKGEQSLTLRPEYTAGICRAYVENKLYAAPQPQKLYGIGPMFRYDRPQAGRYRQFHQFDMEIIGTASPLADAEIITFLWDFYGRLGIEGLIVRLNSVGCPECRAAYRAALQDFLRPNLAKLCTTCQSRFERSPMRVLDCKSDVCRSLSVGAPQITDFLCADCGAHFETVQQTLNSLNIPFTLDSTLVRGLDYYTKTVFELCAAGIGAQSAVCGGGRYDGLIEIIGGQPTPAVGVALGLERLFIILAAQGVEIELTPGIDAFVVTDFADAGATQAAFVLTASLRQSGLSVAMDYEGKSIKSQLKSANRLQAAYAVILAGAELANGKAQIKNMENSEQVEIEISKVRQYLLER